MARGFDAARFRAALWDYLGHPDDETPERRRILYAIVVLRLGLGLLFLLRGWGAVFAAPPDALATRLGDPARWGLAGATADTTLFLLGCTELGVGALLIAGAFTRVSAVTGAVLVILYLLLGTAGIFALPYRCGPGCFRGYPTAGAMVGPAALSAAIGGLLLVVVCGSPFLSTDRALDKLEEEERDRAPATLPALAETGPLFPRLGLAGAVWWLGLWEYWQTANPSWLPLGLAALASLPLLVGFAARLVALPFALLLPLLLVPGRAALADTGWLILALPTVALALLITGPGRASLKARLLARPPAEAAPTGD